MKLSKIVPKGKSLETQDINNFYEYKSTKSDMYDLVKKKKRMLKKKSDGKYHKKSKKSKNHEEIVASEAPLKKLKRSSSNEYNNGHNFSYQYFSKSPEHPLFNIMVGYSDIGWHCTYCNYISSRKSNLKSHFKNERHHMKSERLLTKNVKL